MCIDIYIGVGVGIGVGVSVGIGVGVGIGTGVCLGVGVGDLLDRESLCFPSSSAVGFEPTQLALEELVPSPLGHSGRLSREEVWISSRGGIFKRISGGALQAQLTKSSSG